MVSRLAFVWGVGSSYVLGAPHVTPSVKVEPIHPDQSCHHYIASHDHHDVRLYTDTNELELGACGRTIIFANALPQIFWSRSTKYHSGEF